MTRTGMARVGAAIVLASLALGGCVLAAAGAGAGGGIYFTSRGVESMVPATIEATFSASTRAFDSFDIVRTSYRVEEEKRDLEGKPRDRDVTVKVILERQPDLSSTRVEVTARESLVTWDKDYARSILEKIVELAS